MEHGGKKLACITLDLEHDHWVSDEQRNPTFDHASEYIQMIKELEIPLSVFVVGKVLEWEPELIEQFTEELNVEFHLHSYDHDLTKRRPFGEDLSKGVESFKKFFGREPVGYRAPQGNIERHEIEILEQRGFEFDSSIFPSYRPGVYNNLRKPIEPYYPTDDEVIVEIPFSVAPRLRIPIAQNYLKLLGDPYRFLLKSSSLPNLIVYDSHMQDFYQTEFHNHMDFPLKHLMTRNIHRSKEIFVDFICHLKSRGYEFVTVSQVVNQYR